MAVEGRRRARAVQALEASRYAAHRLLAADPAGLARLGVTVARAGPEALDRLCADGVDVALLRERFPGLYAGTDGLVHLYDCAMVRRSRP
jgi:hypothetical protein